MYAKILHVYDYKCFGKARLELQYPGRTGRNLPEIRSVNLVLGDNGGGKSSILGALAIAVLAPALLESGFVPYRLVRRPKSDQTPVDAPLLKVEAVANDGETFPSSTPRKKLELLARLETRSRSSLDRLHLGSTPSSPISDLIFDDYSPAFFLVGYGATRRVETGNYSESSARRSRGLRYRRVAGLFEDHVPLRPLEGWLPRLESSKPVRFREAVELINRVMPDIVRFSGARDEDDDQYLFDFDGAPTPFASLSDGYKAFIGWVADLIGHLADVAPDYTALSEVPGIVLVDEIDLHLHPAWQRSVVPTLSDAFPMLQFVFATHSPLVASTVRSQNVFVTDTAEDGTATVKQLEENIYGRSVEQPLLSSYFGLQATRPQQFEDEAQVLFRQAAGGDTSAALAYLDRLTSPTSEPSAHGKKRRR